MNHRLVTYRPPSAGISLLVTCAALLLGCWDMPSPLAPTIHGSVGVPHHGVLTSGAALSSDGLGFRRLRRDVNKWGNPRLVKAIQTAAAEVARLRPGAPLVVGDLSSRTGGQLFRHRSHRTGRDVDFLFYAITPDGRSVTSPGFIRFGPDGLARDPDGGYLRLDVERQWLLVKALLSAPDTHVQWLFIARPLEALIVEYARSRGEDDVLVYHAQTVLRQPSDSAVHDDHIHMRIACTEQEAVAGCLGGGYYWPWLPQWSNDDIPDHESLSDEEILSALFED